MNSEQSINAETERIIRAIRFTLMLLVVALSYLPIRATLAIPAFEQIYRDMLNGRGLPALTVFVLKAHYLLLAVSLLIPLAAIVTHFSRRLAESFYVLGGLCVLTLVLFLLMYHGLSAPLFQIIQQMQGG